MPRADRFYIAHRGKDFIGSRTTPGNRARRGGAAETGGHKAESHQRYRADGLAQLAKAGKGSAYCIQKELPGTFGSPRDARRPSLNGGHQIGAAIFEEELRRLRLPA